jgi:hypothetical protein
MRGSKANSKVRDFRGHHKLEYKDWLRFRELMDTALKYRSWKQISKDFGKSNQGWAWSAYRHRPVVFPPDLRRAETYVDELITEANRKEEKMATALEALEAVTETAPAMNGKAKSLANLRGRHKPDLSPEEQQEMLQILSELRQFGVGDWKRISHMLGQSASAATRIRKEQGRTSRETFERAQELISHYRNLRAGVQAPPVEEAVTVAPTRSLPAWEDHEGAVEAQSVQPATAGKEAPKAASADPFAWMEEVQEKLLEISYIVSAAAKLVPAAFRAPFAEKQGRIDKLMEEFNRE